MNVTVIVTDQEVDRSIKTRSRRKKIENQLQKNEIMRRESSISLEMNLLSRSDLDVKI